MNLNESVQGREVVLLEIENLERLTLFRLRGKIIFSLFFFFFRAFLQ